MLLKLKSHAQVNVPGLREIVRSVDPLRSRVVTVSAQRIPGATRTVPDVILVPAVQQVVDLQKNGDSLCTGTDHYSEILVSCQVEVDLARFSARIFFGDTDDRIRILRSIGVAALQPSDRADPPVLGGPQVEVEPQCVRLIPVQRYYFLLRFDG